MCRSCDLTADIIGSEEQAPRTLYQLDAASLESAARVAFGPNDEVSHVCQPWCPINHAAQRDNGEFELGREFPPSTDSYDDWRAAVAAGDTLQSYLEWSA